MGRLEITPELLDARGYQINLAEITGNMSDLLEDLVDHTIEMELDWYYSSRSEDLDGTEYDGEVFHDDFEALFGSVALEYSDFIEEVCPELFGADGPVEITLAMDNAVKGSWITPDYIPVVVNIDGEALASLFYNDMDETTVDDGKEWSGFVRYADDKAWAIHQVLKQLFELYAGSFEEFHLSFDEYFQETVNESVYIDADLD